MKLTYLTVIAGLVLGFFAKAEDLNRIEVPAELLARSKVYRINAVDVARELDRQLAQIKVYMNNYKKQSSFIELRGFHLPFEVKRTTVDLDCGTFCPDLGDAHFYTNDVKLKSADMNWGGNAFKLRLVFEDAGREIKGIHSVLGDNGVPDFNMRNMSLVLSASPVLNANKRATLSFTGANLAANIQSTGGCHIAGVDLCNKIFGTSRKVQKGIEAATVSAFNGGIIQTALVQAVQSYLSQLGVNQTILSLRLEGSVIVITTL